MSGQDELLLTPEERNACAERGEKRWAEDGKKENYEFNFLWQYVVDEVIKTLLAKVKQHYEQKIEEALKRRDIQWIQFLMHRGVMSRIPPKDYNYKEDTPSKVKRLDRPELREIQAILKPLEIFKVDIDKYAHKLLALIPDIEDLIVKLKQAVRDARDGKDIDLPAELYEVFCSVQNQAIEEAKDDADEWKQLCAEFSEELTRQYNYEEVRIEEVKKQERERIISLLKVEAEKMGKSGIWLAIVALEEEK